MIIYYEVEGGYCRDFPSIRKVIVKREIKDYKELENGMVSFLEIGGGFCPHRGVEEDCFHKGFRTLEYAKEYALNKLEEIYEKERDTIEKYSEL